MNMSTSLTSQPRKAKAQTAQRRLLRPQSKLVVSPKWSTGLLVLIHRAFYILAIIP